LCNHEGHEDHEERVLRFFEVEREMRMTKKVPDPIKSLKKALVDLPNT